MRTQGHTEAWFHLGVMHLNGWGTARNLQQAQYFFSMAAKVGLPTGSFVHVTAEHDGPLWSRLAGLDSVFVLHWSPSTDVQGVGFERMIFMLDGA